MNFNAHRSTVSLTRTQRIDASIFFLISLVLTVYLVVRAILVPMAHDEIATFYYFVQSGNVSPFLSNIDTNNHFLNSLLTWIFYHLFGPSPLVLRLSNLVFIPVFFIFLYKISQLLSARVLRFTFFVTLAFTLHFIEFLALSRGYGISMALLTASIYHLLKGNGEQHHRHYIYSLICIFIGSTANLALINTYALILFYISVSLIIRNSQNLKRVIGPILFAGLIPVSIVIVQILYIKINAGLIAGSPENFWGTTIITLFAYLFESSHESASLIAAILFTLIALSGLIYMYKLKNIKLIVAGNPFKWLYLFAGNILIILILGIFFKVNYPDDRIGIYLYPLAAGSLIFALDHLLMNKKWVTAAAIPFLILPIHFFMFFNTTYSVWYKFDVIPRRFYGEVMKNHKAGAIPPTLAGHGMRIFCWSYLNYLQGGEASQFYFTHFPDYNADFQIINLKMIPGWQQNYDTIDYDRDSQRHLLKHRKVNPPQLLIARRIQAIRKTSAEFVAVAEGQADTLRNKNIRFDFNFSLLAAKEPFNSRIVIDIRDKQHKSLLYEYIQFNWLRLTWNGTPGNFSNCMLLYQIPPEASEYKIYIWNIGQTEFEISEGYFKINDIGK